VTENPHEIGGPASVAAAAEAVLSLENAGLPLIVTHPDGRVALVNRALRDLLGYGLSDLVNRPVWELHVDPDVGRRFFHKLLQTGHAWDHFLVLRRRDGEAVPTYSSAIVTKDDDGTVGLVVSHCLPA
jgi:PAS domain S-box-containing protein